VIQPGLGFRRFTQCIVHLLPQWMLHPQP
jgi:hypothetical protein